MRDEPITMPDGYDPNIATEEEELSIPGHVNELLTEWDAIAHSDEPDSARIFEFKDFLPRTDNEPGM